MYQVLLVIFLLVASSLVALIMLQQGKEINMGSSFSTGVSGTMFGSTGYDNFLNRVMVVLATLFFVLSLVLGNLSSNHDQQGVQWDKLLQVKHEDKISAELLTKLNNDIP